MVIYGGGGGGDTESCCSSRVEEAAAVRRRRRPKVEVFEEVLRRLRELPECEEVSEEGFEDELWSHFIRLPLRYALDVNIERAQEVLMHKKLLHMAHDPKTRPAFEARLIQLQPSVDENGVDSTSSYTRLKDAQISIHPGRQSTHPPPAFGLSSNIELAIEDSKSDLQGGNGAMSANPSRPLHEITISTSDKPKLLCKLTSLLSEIGLNIQEAHAFSTSDGYSLDVFVVNGWPYEETEKLRNVLAMEIPRVEVVNLLPLGTTAYFCLDEAHPVYIHMNGLVGF